MKTGSRMWPGIVACTLLTGCVSQTARPVARPPLPGPVGASSRNSLAVDLSPVAVSVEYARKLSTGAWVGAGLGAGAQLGIMVFEDEFSAGGYGADRVFVQLVHGDVLVRTAAGRKVQVEAGVRAAWLYHPPTEYETRFIGVQGTTLVRIGRIRLGPRLVLGHMSEEAGRSAFNVGLVPLIVRLEWAW